MSLFASRISGLPPSVRRLVEDFRDGLVTTLGQNLVGAYLHGSIAFPEYKPASGDIDFYVVVGRPFSRKEMKTLDALHRSLANRYEFGRKLDGFYIPLSKTRMARNPRGLVYGADSRIHQGGSDDAWALHREHFHGSAYIRLHGPRPNRLFPTADWPAIRTALFRQLAYARRIVDSDPWWAVLNLCRLIYNFEMGRIVISKLGAARWALKRLPSKWRPVIRSAIKTYKGSGRSKDRTILRRDARGFVGFASIRIIAFDSTWNSRQPRIAHFRMQRMPISS